MSSVQRNRETLCIFETFAQFLTDTFSPQFIDRISIDRTDVHLESYSRVVCLLELIMLKRGVVQIPYWTSSVLARHTLRCLVRLMRGVSFLYFIFSLFFIFFIYLFLYSVYDFIINK